MGGGKDEKAVTKAREETPEERSDRLLFQQRLKRELVATGQRAALAGLATLAVVLALTLFLVFDVVVGRGAATVAGGVALAALVVVWAVVPLTYGRRRRA